MPDGLWLAASALANALKETPKIRSFRRGFDLAPSGDDFPERVSQITARYSPLRSHPMLLGVRLNHLPATEQLFVSESDESWLGDAVEAGTAFQVVIEFLRSRLPGYPILRLPHLRDGSPHVLNDPFFVQGFPWDAELRRLGLQLREPPDMTQLGGADDCSELLADLAGALQQWPAWRRLVAAQGALSQCDRRTLGTLGKRYASRVEEDAVTEAAGDLLLARFYYRLSALQELVDSAEGRVGEYLRAFEDVDELITVVAAVMETLMTSDLLAVEPYRMDVGQGESLHPVELAIRGDNPFHTPGEVLYVQGPNAAISGLVYPTAITHRWGRLDEPENARMIISGKLAADSA